MPSHAGGEHWCPFRRDLSRNRLSKGLQPLSKLAVLEFMDVHDNMLTDTVPTEIGSLVGLRSLLAHQNGIGGSMPTEIGLLKQLAVLRLHRNRLIGSLPSELGMSSSLMELRVFDQEGITGTVPASLGDLARLHLCELSSAHPDDATNSFFGPLPAPLSACRVHILPSPSPPSLPPAPWPSSPPPPQAPPRPPSPLPPTLSITHTGEANRTDLNGTDDGDDMGDSSATVTDTPSQTSLSDEAIVVGLSAALLLVITGCMLYGLYVFFRNYVREHQNPPVAPRKEGAIISVASRAVPRADDDMPYRPERVASGDMRDESAWWMSFRRRARRPS